MLKVLGFYFGRRKEPTREQILKTFLKQYNICMKTFDNKLKQHTMANDNINKKLDKIIELLKSRE